MNARCSVGAAARAVRCATESPTPIDYQRLLDDVRLGNLIDYRLQAIRLNQLRRFGESVEEMSALLEVLDARLEAR